MKFEWDPRKAAKNLSRHGVSFREAATVLGDSLGATVSDPDHSSAEDRYITVGSSNRGRLLGEREKALLQTAAVVGDELGETLLARVVEMPIDAVREALRALVHSGFMHEVAAYPDAVYGFRHC